MKKFLRKFRRSMKAISPVIATLLMIVIAVAASLVAYAWVMGYLGFTTAKVGKAIQIQSIAKDELAPTTTIHVWVQNVGDSPVELSDVYIDGELDTTASVTLKGLPALLKGVTQEIISVNYYSGADQVTVKVVNADGSFIEYTKTFVE